MPFSILPDVVPCEKPRDPRFKDLTWHEFEELVVIGFFGRHRRTDKLYWTCVCSCGEVKLVSRDNLRNGHNTSCGCRKSTKCKASATQHGQGCKGAKTKEYRIWMNMRNRCRNPRNPAYPDYGGRGITVCDRWDSFESFFADMGPCPPRMSLDRRENEKGYGPDNCRWATVKTQNRNRRDNHRLTYAGKTLCLAAWGELLGLHPRILRMRIRAGWTVERALTTPKLR